MPLSITKMYLLLRFLLCLVASLLSTISTAQSPSWHDGAGGATRDFYHQAARLRWQDKPADWIDRQGRTGGSDPWGRTTIPPVKTPKTISINVTDAVNKWLSGSVGNEGFLLALMPSGGILLIGSREAGRPHTARLLLDVDNTRKTLYAKYDTYLDRSTVKGLGGQEYIKVARGTPGLIWFDLNEAESPGSVLSAVLYLEVQKTYGSKPINLGVFLANPGGGAKSDPITYGIAKDYDGDRGIDMHAAVIYAESFEGNSWRARWKDGGRMGERQVTVLKAGYVPLQGNSLKATLPKGALTGLNQRYQFRKNSQDEPESAYFRYYVRLGDNWDQTVSGGKFPGFAGTYNRAGWGSRKPNGTNGWSARGSFSKSYSAIGDEQKRLTPIGSYVYHLDQNGSYGSNWGWGLSGGASLEKNRWYCVEQYLKLNTPGEKDGVLQAWLDGRKVFEKDGLRFRNTRELKIEEVWFNFYHGGMTPSPHEQTLYFDNLVVSTEYIGPMKN